MMLYITDTFHLFIEHVQYIGVYALRTHNSHADILRKWHLLHKDNPRNNKHAIAVYIAWYYKYKFFHWHVLYRTQSCNACWFCCLPHPFVKKVCCLAIWVAEMLSGRAAGMLRRKLASVFASLQRDDASARKLIVGVRATGPVDHCCCYWILNQGWFLTVS